jgi:nicotinamidase-related amidase
MGRVSNEELLKRYWALGLKPREPKLSRATTALLCIDLQYLDAHPDYGFGALAKTLGIADFMDDYWERLNDTVLPNVARLQATARAVGVEVVHCHVGLNTPDGRDKNAGRFGRAGVGDLIQQAGTEFLPQVAPQGDEVVIRKFTQSPFNSTNIDRVLRDLGVKDLIIVGVVTDGCVESTARSAAELDYGVYVVEDGTAAVGRQLHDNSILSMSTVTAAITTTDAIVKELEALRDSAEPAVMSTAAR